MVDGLTNEESILAWRAHWHPSFVGIAIVNEDFTFRSANPQFCKLLGVSPADLINKKFQDITPPGIKELDMKNSELAKAGLVPFYFLPKSYEFADGREVKVMLLVVPVHCPNTKEFRFFVSRIMLDQGSGSLTGHIEEISSSEQSFQRSIGSVVDFMMKYGKWLAAIGTIIGAVAVSVMGLR